MCCVEKCIKFMRTDEMEEQQCFSASPQSNMEQVGEFGFSDSLNISDFVGPTYMLVSLVGYKSAEKILNFLTDTNNRPIYPVQSM